MSAGRGIAVVCGSLIVGYPAGILLDSYRRDYPFDLWALSRPLVLNMDAENAHRLAVYTSSLPRSIREVLGLVKESHSTQDSRLKCAVWGLEFSSPIGLAAGFDKHAECMEGMFQLGFGFVEIGSVTPKPQEGNEKPRVWRFAQDLAVVNRYGFNSQGHAAVRERLRAYSKVPGKILGVNLGKNKETEDPAADFLLGLENLGEFADYIVVNVSSPNTPGLRDLQKKEFIEKLLLEIKTFRDQQFKDAKSPPLLVKIAPDLTQNDLENIAAAVTNVGIDGLIISNTTIARPGGIGEGFSGGLSGAPLFPSSTEILKRMYRLTKGEIPLIGVGGVCSAEDAYMKIRAGASLVQLYSAMSILGPNLPSDINKGLGILLEKDGFQNVSEAVGADVEL